MFRVEMGNGFSSEFLKIFQKKILHFSIFPLINFRQFFRFIDDLLFGVFLYSKGCFLKIFQKKILHFSKTAFKKIFQKNFGNF